MLRLFDNAQYEIIGRWRLAAALSVMFMLPGLGLFAVRGLNTSIEFTGGTLLQIHAETDDINTAGIRAALGDAGITGAEIQTFGAPDEFVIRARLDPRANVTEQSTQETEEAVRVALVGAFGAESFTVERTEAVGPKVGSELRERATLALLMGLGATFLVLWFRYEWRFGLAAVIATFHDVVATVAFVAYLNLEVSLVVVAALLTLIGYSLNDTIVTFDRVRENVKRSKRHDFFYDLLNQSINETLPRTVLTSGTTLAAVVALLVLGGSVIRPFAWVMTFGIIVGTFSSIFIASPVLLWVERRWPSEDVKVAKSTGMSAPATA